MNQCEKCGQTVAEGAAFCTNCGAPVSSSVNITPNPSEPTAVSGGTINTNMSQPLSESSINTVPTDAMAMNVETTQASTPEKKKVDGKMIGVIVGSIICLAVGIVGIVLAATSGNKGGDEVAVNSGSTTGDDSGGGSTIDVHSSGTKVELDGYEFVIPDDYEYEMGVDATDNSKYIMYSDNKDAYVGQTAYLGDATFTAVESNIDSLVTELAAKATEATSGSGSYNGVDFVYANVKGYDGYNVVYAFSDADLHCFMTFVITELDKDGVQYLENVSKVVASAQKKKTMDRSFGGGADYTKIRKINLDGIK